MSFWVPLFRGFWPKSVAWVPGWRVGSSGCPTAACGAEPTGPLEGRMECGIIRFVLGPPLMLLLGSTKVKIINKTRGEHKTGYSLTCLLSQSLLIHLVELKIYTMSLTEMYEAVQAAWVEGRLENVLQRQKELVRLHKILEESRSDLMAAVSEGT